MVNSGDCSNWMSIEKLITKDPEAVTKRQRETEGEMKKGERE